MHICVLPGSHAACVRQIRFCHAIYRYLDWERYIAHFEYIYFAAEAYNNDRRMFLLLFIHSK